MAKTYGPYTRVTRARRLPMGYAQLWRAEDYLMQVLSTGFTETYQRFYWRDVQGIFVVPTRRRRNVFLLLLIPALLFVLIAALAQSWWPMMICCGLLLPIQVWNALKGTGADLYLVTRVQVKKLESLSRRRVVLRVLEELRPLINAAQADLSASAAPATVQPPQEPPVQA
jgi:hypothetical protein